MQNREAPAKRLMVFVIALGLLMACQPPAIDTANAAKFKLSSPAFEDSGLIPQKYTCQGDNVSPELNWSEAPANTKSFALIMDDPDAPHGTFTHWMLHDIPATTSELQAHAGTALRNSFGRAAYGGPCPPPGHGPHRYVFTLYAIDVPALGVRGKTRASLEQAVRAHTLGTARLIGRYERKA